MWIGANKCEFLVEVQVDVLSEPRRVVVAIGFGIAKGLKESVALEHLIHTLTHTHAHTYKRP